MTSIIVFHGDLHKPPHSHSTLSTHPRERRAFCSLLCNSVEIVIKTQTSKVQRKRYSKKKKERKKKTQKELYLSPEIHLWMEQTFIWLQRTLNSSCKAIHQRIDLFRIQNNSRFIKNKTRSHFKCLHIIRNFIQWKTQCWSVSSYS